MNRICYIFSNYYLKDITGQPSIAWSLSQKAQGKENVFIISNSETDKVEEKNQLIIKGKGDFKTYVANIIKIIFYIRKTKPNMIHVNGNLLTIFIWYINRFFHIPMSCYLCEGLEISGYMIDQILLYCLKRINHIFVSCEYIKKQLLEKNIKKDKITVIRIGLKDIYRKSNEDKNYISDILFFGDSSKNRGFDYIYKLAKQLTKWNFTILIRWRKNCKRELEEISGLKNVKIYYYPYKKTLSEYILKSKIILLPFRWMGVRPPLSIIECMAMKKCVVTSQLEGNEELINNGVNGYSINFNNINMLIKLISNLLEDNKKRELLEQNAKESVEKLFSDTEYDKVYQIHTDIIKVKSNTNIDENRLLALCSMIYPKKIINGKIRIGKNFNDIVNFTKKNRLDYFFSQKFKNTYTIDITKYYILNNIQNEFKKYMNIIDNTINKIAQKSGKSPVLIIKTFSSFPHKTSDIDMIINDKSIAIKIMSVINKNIKFPIDIKDTISWTTSDEIRRKFIWENIIPYKADKYKNIFKPNVDLDILIRLGHITFEEGKIRLGELLHIFKYVKDVDWKKLHKEVKKCGWNKSFNYMLKIINNLHNKMYGEKLFSKYNIYNNDNEILEFPYKIPYKILIHALIEKKAWKKIYGARYIMKDRALQWINKKIN